MSDVERYGKGSIRIEGLGKLDKKLAKLVEQVEAREVDKALKAAVKPIEEAAKGAAPVRKGILKGSVQTERTGDKQVAVLAKDFKAWWIEMGTVNHPAQPFLLPAFHTNRREAIAIFRRLLKRAIDREAES